MGLESVTYINDLVTTNPDGTADFVDAGDDHIRNIKTGLKNSFPDVDQAVSTIIFSATEPALKRKGTLWGDETTNLLKLRDKTNTSWIVLGISMLTSNSVDINAGSIDGTPIGAAVPSTGAFSSVDIDGGNIDGTIIGATTPAAANVTTLDLTGNLTTAGLIDTRDVGADGTKLDTIETSATADQTDAEIKTAYENNADTNAFNDAEKAKVGVLSVELLETVVISNDPFIAIDSAVDFTAYDNYIFELIDLKSATNNVFLDILTSTDGGSTYDNGALDYNQPAGGSTQLRLSINGLSISSSAGFTLNGYIKLMSPSNSSNVTLIKFDINGHDNLGIIGDFVGIGSRDTAADVDGVRFSYSSGNLSSGTIKVYGIK